MRLNCWEFRGCGRGPEGEKIKDLGVCPAATEARLHGSNRGRNGGRACWVIAGTFCKGKDPETFFEKYQLCVECDFYNRVREEEGHQFILAPFLLQKIKD